MIRAQDFRDPAVADRLLTDMRELLAGTTTSLTFMEVCGTHTMAIHQYGIRAMLPEEMRLVSGPGCPVCVTPTEYIDKAIVLSRRSDTIIATFGDMLRVPGSQGSLIEAQARGAEVRIVYSSLDALDLAVHHPDREIVFLGVGFETTAPTVAGAILRAREQGLANFTVLCAHKTMPAAMAALSADPDLQVDGYLCPAHVSVVIGADAYQPLAEDHGVACVVTGFEPIDILQGLAMLTRQLVAGEPRVENQYRRFVTEQGNRKARRIIETVFEPCAATWRGLGPIPGSGLQIRKEFSRFDADRRFPLRLDASREPEGCRCGDVLKGKTAPRDCPLFGERCTPEKPVGACMVSSEGSCAAEYKYGVDH